MNTDTTSVPTAYAQSLLQAARQQGCDTARLLQELSISRADIDDSLVRKAEKEFGARAVAVAPEEIYSADADIFAPCALGGVINLITGKSSEIGDAMLTHPLVRRINFTGSIAAGRAVMAKAAEGLKPVTLELGGNDPAIVLEDAELDDGAFQRMVMGTFMTAGQICMALKRLYVHRSRYGEVVERFTAFAGKAVVGDGLDPEVTMGPVNNKAQFDIVAGMIDEAKARGATVNPVGTVKDQAVFERGHFHRPTIVTDAEPDLLVVREEQFGPVLPIMPFDSDAEAVALANDSDYGLCSSVWSADRDRAVGIARQLEAGYTYLNGHGPLAQDSRGPFGGFKNSGIGRNLGYEGIIEFQQYHSISGPPGFLGL